MSDIGIRVSKAALALFQGDQGLPGTVSTLAMAAEIQAPAFQTGQVMVSNVAPELAEKASYAKYPVVHIYCEKVTNQLREKFRTFSGTVRVAAEARVSQSRIDNIESNSQLLSDAITEVLDASRGDWGNGMFFAGGYEINYGPVKTGGKNFVQITKIVFEVDVSSN
uniref:Uncharacterized protein n=1 Tax=uncultured bacterium CSLF43 TaxID=1091575 RepID=G4WW25_9BACT|nr:hypothetical protein [uncultured bacterium CSLF43]